MALLGKHVLFAELLQKSDGQEMPVSEHLQPPANSGRWTTKKVGGDDIEDSKFHMTTPQGMSMPQSPLPFMLLMISALQYSRGYASQRPTVSNLGTQVVARDVPISSLERQFPRRHTTKSVVLACIGAMNGIMMQK